MNNPVFGFGFWLVGHGFEFGWLSRHTANPPWNLGTHVSGAQLLGGTQAPGTMALLQWIEGARIQTGKKATKRNKASHKNQNATS